MIYHDDIATRVEIDDAGHRQVNLTHFAGRGTMTMFMQQGNHLEMRIDRRVAAELAILFDHFARNGQLPISFPQPEHYI